ncbi:YpzG family protein [Halobacillus halophilus]|nr:YpzG family protein [Halobacillus halophilus]MCA1010010.1 YpzG family protein [Halobacillus halophilus]
MGKKNFKPSASPFYAHRGVKHLSNKVNGETEQTQSDIITEVQAKKRM